MQRLLLEQMDRSRREFGVLLDILGLGRAETPHRVAFSESGVSLKAYGDGDTDGGAPALLLIPAPIKGSYLWDLAPDISVVQQCLRCGFRVYLVQWEPPGLQMRGFGLADYADRLIFDCLQAVRAEGWGRQVFLVGHSLGGTLAAIFAALHPERVRGVVLLGSPLHFGAAVGALGPVVAAAPHARLLTAMLGDVPGSFLNAVSVLAAPMAFEWSRWLDWLTSLSDEQAWRTHLRVERWALDELPLARRFFEEIVEQLCREDRLMQGSLFIWGRRVGPDLLELPILCVVDPRCPIAPPESILPFLKAMKAIDTRLLLYEGDTGVALQHAGMLVGRRAHQHLWPEILHWVRVHS